MKTLENVWYTAKPTELPHTPGLSVLAVVGIVVLVVVVIGLIAAGVILLLIRHHRKNILR